LKKCDDERRDNKPSDEERYIRWFISFEEQIACLAGVQYASRTLCSSARTKEAKSAVAAELGRDM
jgi:hypothetical protein